MFTLDLASLWPFRVKSNGHAAMHALEAPQVWASQPKAEDDLARVLSPTQVSTFLECSAKWWYKHGLRLPELKSSNLGIGIAFHDAVMENFRQKIETKEDLPVAGTRALFRGSWESMKDDLVFGPKEEPDDLRDLGESLVDEYMTKVAPRIEPAAAVDRMWREASEG